MKNYKNKIENFCLAATRLNEAITIYRQEPENTLLQDGLIQRFEFTFELAWKSLKDYLIDQGVAPSLTFPKEILKEAYAANIISDSDTWNRMLVARNTTSHIYDERIAAKIAASIADEYAGVLLRLKAFYEKKQ